MVSNFIKTSAFLALAYLFYPDNIINYINKCLDFKPENKKKPRKTFPSPFFSLLRWNLCLKGDVFPSMIFYLTRCMRMHKNNQDRDIYLFKIHRIIHRINGTITVHILQLAFFSDIMFSRSYPYEYKWVQIFLLTLV